MLPSQPTYTGPLVVLTSRGSASASEIVAGMLQFHRRALVVGSGATFGKGSVQTYIPLAKMSAVSGREHWGILRMTAQLYYLPAGAGVQRRGILPDLVLPAAPPLARPSESDLPGALDADDLDAPAEALPEAAQVTPALVAALRNALERHVRQLPEWELWRREIADLQRPTGPRSLRLDDRQREWRERRTRWTDLAVDRRELARSAAFPTIPLQLRSVERQQAAHAAKAAGALPASPASILDTVVLLPSPQGPRAVPFAEIRFPRFSAEAAALAQAWTVAVGTDISAQQIDAALFELAVAGPLPVDGPTLIRTFRDHAAVTGDQARRGAEAVLAKMAELEPELVGETRALDIPLREAQRLAAAWSELADSAP